MVFITVFLFICCNVLNGVDIEHCPAVSGALPFASFTSDTVETSHLSCRWGGGQVLGSGKVKCVSQVQGPRQTKGLWSKFRGLPARKSSFSGLRRYRVQPSGSCRRTTPRSAPAAPTLCSQLWAKAARKGSRGGTGLAPAGSWGGSRMLGAVFSQLPCYCLVSFWYWH